MQLSRQLVNTGARRPQRNGIKLQGYRVNQYGAMERLSGDDLLAVARQVASLDSAHAGPALSCLSVTCRAWNDTIDDSLWKVAALARFPRLTPLCWPSTTAAHQRGRPNGFISARSTGGSCKVSLSSRGMHNQYVPAIRPDVFTSSAWISQTLRSRWSCTWTAHWLAAGRATIRETG